MARAVRRDRAVPVSLDINPDVTAASNPEETGGPNVASLFDFQGDARVRVLHRNEKTQRFEPHGYFPPNATEEDVLNEFGGGRFRVQLLVRDDTGREIIKTTRDFDLPGEYKLPPGDLPGIGSRAIGGAKPKVFAAESPAVAPQLPNNNDLMEVLKAGIINTLLDMMKTSRESRPSGPDPMLLKLMEQQAATQQKMMEFMLTLATRPQSGGREETFELLEKAKGLLGGPAAVGNPMEMFNTMLEAITRMRDVAEDISPAPSRSGDPLMDSIPQLVGVIAEQHEMNKKRSGAPPVAAPPVPVAKPVVAEQPMALWQRILRGESKRLVSFAVAKQDPDLIAGTAIVLAPPHIREALALFLHRAPEVVEVDVLTEIPELGEHREWLADFIQAAQERLFPDEFTYDDEPTDADAGEATGEVTDGH